MTDRYEQRWIQSERERRTELDRQGWIQIDKQRRIGTDINFKMTETYG